MCELKRVAVTILIHQPMFLNLGNQPQLPAALHHVIVDEADAAQIIEVGVHLNASIGVPDFFCTGKSRVQAAP